MDEDLKKNMLKTGTTTIGIVTKEGIVIAADKKGTYADSHGGVHYVAGEFEKIKRFNDDIIMTIAGVATFCLRAITMAKAEIKLKELKEKKKSSIRDIANLFSVLALQSLQSGGVIGYLIAGREKGKTYLYEVASDGILKEIDTYKIDGSGMMHVNAILDTEYRENLTLKEGIELAKRCIRGSSGRDPGSGIGYEIWTVTSEEVKKVEEKVWKMD